MHVNPQIEGSLINIKSICNNDPLFSLLVSIDDFLGICLPHPFQNNIITMYAHAGYVGRDEANISPENHLLTPAN
jgi:hypothetical protein